METIFVDFAPKGVQFYYLYKALAHPELNGYINPYTLEERLLHVQEAKRTIGSGITWLCDAITNDAKHLLGDRPNSEFVIDPTGKVIRARTWSDPQQLRADLETLVGHVENPTQFRDLDIGFEAPPPTAARGIVPRIRKPGRMIAVRIEPKIEDTPFYAKLRAEVSTSMLQSGSGTLYLGFHMDPIYHVHWNNLADPIEYKLKSTAISTISPSTGIGPKVDVEYDLDPREFLIEIENASFSDPLELTVRYFACNESEGWCIPVTQQYSIFLDRDPDAGNPSRGGGGFAGNRRFSGDRFGRSGGGQMAALGMIIQGDWDGDGKLAIDEIPSRLEESFEDIDQNSDQYLDETEISAFFQSQGSQSSSRRSPRGFDRLMQNDQNEDGKLTKAELPEQFQRRFESMDLNADGYLDQKELESIPIPGQRRRTR